MPAVHSIDLNADLGESFGRWQLGDDDAMLELVTSANVACGFHAGDPRGLLDTCRRAAARGVAIGAQVGYRDLAGFGRRFIDVSTQDLYADVLYQVAALDGLARVAGSRVGYVKPHGALYNAVVHHRDQAQAVVRAVCDHPADLRLLGLPGSVLLEEAERAGLTVVREAFADRAYRADGTLQPRTEPGAVLHDPAEVARRAVGMVLEGRVTAVDGSRVDLACESVCVHGDSPDAVALARAVRAQLESAGVVVRPFLGRGDAAPDR